MARKSMGKKRGRHLVDIDEEIFENACAIQCTLEEISGLFGVCEDTIERWCKRHYGENFADIYKKKSAKGKISLRRNQFALSKTNATMAIWLGKQYLGQKDYVEPKIDLENGSITINIKDCSHDS